MSKITILCTAVAIAITGCMSDDQSLRLNAEKHVKSMLKDPESARFGDIYLVPGEAKDGVQSVAVCGLVNAKNSFGGYGGGERFVAYGYKGKVGGSKLLGISRAYFEGTDRRATVDTINKPQKTTIFEKIHWNQACVDATHPPTFSGEYSAE